MKEINIKILRKRGVSFVELTYAAVTYNGLGEKLCLLINTTIILFFQFVSILLLHTMLPLLFCIDKFYE